MMDWWSMSSDLNSIEHLWGILKRKVEERKVSNIHQLRDVKGDKRSVCFLESERKEGILYQCVREIQKEFKRQCCPQKNWPL